MHNYVVMNIVELVCACLWMSYAASEQEMNWWERSCSKKETPCKISCDTLWSSRLLRKGVLWHKHTHFSHATHTHTHLTCSTLHICMHMLCAYIHTFLAILCNMNPTLPCWQCTWGSSEGAPRQPRICSGQASERSRVFEAENKPISQAGYGHEG